MFEKILKQYLHQMLPTEKVSSPVSQIALIANAHGEKPQGCVWWGKVEIQRREKMGCIKNYTELISI